MVALTDEQLERLVWLYTCHGEKCFCLIFPLSPVDQSLLDLAFIEKVDENSNNKVRWFDTRLSKKGTAAFHCIDLQDPGRVARAYRNTDSVFALTNRIMRLPMGELPEFLTDKSYFVRFYAQMRMAELEAGV